MKLKVDPVKVLKGRIKISGSKNATLPLMVCSMLTDETLILNNVPNISDVMMMKEILIDVGIDCIYLEDKKKMILKKKKIKPISYMENINKVRASLYVIGGLIANKKNFQSCYPGGCSFSDRPIDYHLDAFRHIGYKISEKNKQLKFKKKRINRKNIIFNMKKQSVGTTINILFISVLRRNKTIIKNASLEPEVLEVINLLNKMHAQISVDEQNNIIVIEGVSKLFGTKYDIMSDRIEAGSYMLLASTVDISDVLIENVNLNYLKEVINTIKEFGVKVYLYNTSIRIKKDYPIVGINKVASTYPNFPTDLQQLLCVACTKAITTSIIKDEIYPDRLTHIYELKKAKANVIVKDNIIFVNSSKLTECNLYAHDLRCGFACIIMACIMSKSVVIDNCEIIFRGYENLLDKLISLGVNSQLVE